MEKIYPLIMAGGSGTRLWPSSRLTYPKQFTRMHGEESLFQQTLRRVNSQESSLFAPATIMTNESYRFIVGEQISEIPLTEANVVIEPEGKNTAASILAACLLIHKMDPNAIILAKPSDHVIPDVEKFHQLLEIGRIYTEKDQVVTFGIRPSHAETGYGYLHLGNNLAPKVDEVLNFVEKPNRSTAEQFVSSGEYLWNSGIFLFRAADIIHIYQNLYPDSFGYVQNATENRCEDLDFIRLDKESWSKLPNISIDNAIMEKLNNIVAVSLEGDWSDLGDWEAVWKIMHKDQSGVAKKGFVTTVDCKDSLLVSEAENIELVGLGLDDIIAVAMQDAVLIASKHRAQDVKNVVEILRSEGRKQANLYPIDHRPWGWFESLVMDNGFQVKRIMVKPGASLSLQSHNHRSEHWVVVSGTAKVTIDKEVKLVSEGESIYVPLGARHRMENPGKIPMYLIEVQIGRYLGEDDIIRYEDRYKR